MITNENVMLRILNMEIYSIDFCTSSKKPGEHSYWRKQIQQLFHKLTCLQVPLDGRKLSQEAVTGEGLDELLLARLNPNYQLLAPVSHVLLWDTHIMSFVMLR
jgi:hypothetical protein